MVRLEGSIKRFIGSSSDTKPIVGGVFDGSVVTNAGLTAGSSFLETDTGRIYRWNGTEWTIPEYSDASDQYLAAILQALEELPERLAEVLASV